MRTCTRASHRNLRLTASALLLAALAFSFMPASAARAATVTVTDQTDTTNAACVADGTTIPCSLRDAVTYANANAGTTISVPAGTYTLTSGELALSADMTITGAGASSTFVQHQGNTSFRIVHQTAGTATITGLTLRYGFAGGGSNGGAVYAAGTALTLNSSTISNSGADFGGGGIYVNSGTTVTLNDCTVSNNQQQTGSSTDGGGGIRNNGTLNVNRSTFGGNSTAKNGGAIYNNYQSGGAVTITNSTFSSNTSSGTGGGAIAQQGNGTMTITSSTFSSNTSTGSGGALYNTNGVTIANSTFSGNRANGGAGNGGGAIYNAGGGTITNSTFSGNTAPNGSGGALYSISGITFVHTTFSGNTASAAPATNEFTANGLTLKNSIVNGACTASGSGVTSQDYNLTSGSGCWTAKAHDLLSTNPNLGPLQDNGGPTFTMAIPRTSPAIEKIPSSGANCAATDQRGIVRPQPANGLCDIGAFEVQILNPTGLVVSGFPSPQAAGVAGAVTVTAQDAQGNVAFGYTGTIHFTSSDPQAVLPSDYSFTASDQGVHIFSLTLKTAGTQTIAAKDTADATVTGTQANITVNPATAASLTLAGHPASVTAGTPGSVTVMLKDAYGNVATGYTGTVRFTSSDAQAAKPADYTFTSGSGMDNGTHTFTNGITLKTAGTQLITATDTGNGSLTSTLSGITVTAAGMSQFLVTGYPSPAAANTSNSFTVIARDAYGNTMSGYGGTVHFTSDDAQAILPGDYTFGAADAGVHVFNATLRTTGTRGITATYTTATPALTGTQSGITVTPAASMHLVVSAPANASAGTAVSVPVTAKDSLDNAVTGYMRTIRFTSTDPEAALPGDYTFVAADNGTHTFSVTLKTAGGRTITATDLSDGTIAGTVAVTVSGPMVAAVSPISGSPAGGTKITLTGANLQGASVAVGGATCTGVQVNGTGTSLTCVTPSHAGNATVEIVVTTGSGSATLAHAYTYVAPGSVGVPSGRSPGSGSSGAGGSPAPAPTGR
jgi:predicted outer membrane repeat protein